MYIELKGYSLGRLNTIEMGDNALTYLAACEDGTARWNRKGCMIIKGFTELFTEKHRGEQDTHCMYRIRLSNKVRGNKANAIQRRYLWSWQLT